jgi:hypothetical protein
MNTVSPWRVIRASNNRWRGPQTATGGPRQRFGVVDEGCCRSLHRHYRCALQSAGVNDCDTQNVEADGAL